jgi:antitoxin component YwqK of YwqJK toxin-antitoxin module
MTKYIAFLSLTVWLFSCSEATPKQAPKKPQSLTQVVDGTFTEYYPGRQKIKFRGEQDAEGQRHGKWVFYAENGIELSITHYIHGVREGVTIVKYPNGTIHYVGEYSNDKEVGLWKTYDENQKLVEEKDFDALNAAGL